MFVRTLSAEVLKYRRTSALWLALGLPLAVELLLLLIFFVVPDVKKLSLTGRWNFFTHSPLTTWIQTFLPLGLGIIAALALGLEHQDNQWKHALVLGPSRVMVYLAKVLAVTALILTASVVLALSGLVVGGLFTGFHGIPWAEVGRGAGLAFLGSLGMISLQTWLATRFRAIGLSIGAALFLAILGATISHSGYWAFVPWAYPASATSFPGTLSLLPVALSVLVAAVVTALAAWDFNRRDMV